MTSTRIALLAAAVLFACQAPAHANEWEILGRRNVNIAGDHDTIPVGLKGKYKKIKLKVVGNAIHVADLKVHFANGSVQDVSVRANIPKGGETRVIDLPGAARVIKKITMTYRTKMRKLLRRGKAEVIVFGKKVTGGVTVVPPPAVAKKPLAPVQWVLLGSRDVKFKAEKDTIPVTAGAGLFKKIKLKVQTNAVHVIDLKVHFVNGEVTDVSIRKDIAKGGETRVIDLPGAARHIKKIVLRYKSKTGWKGLVRGHASVKVFGKKIVGTGGVVVAPPTPKPAAPVAQPGKWERLGERQVKWRAERDTIMVTAAEGRFTALKFKVRTADIHMLDMKVHFANGDVQDVGLRFKIAAGSESRVIDLPGNKRVIKKVVFVYKKSGGALKRLKRAFVALWGRH